jgi:uncharacterized membrane protein
VRTIILYISLVFGFSCTLPAEKRKAAVEKKLDTIRMQTDTEYQAVQDTPVTAAITVKSEPPLRNPSGIYQGILELEGKMEQTVAFYPDMTYRLEEHYVEKDSTVALQGTWAPSNGFIWLYDDHVVRARYRWKGETLEYYNPLNRKSYPMQSRTGVMVNKVWREKKNAGLSFYGIGNEPFWNIEFTKTDTLSFLLSEWSKPIRLKLKEKSESKDSAAYLAGNDSTQLKLTIYPLFCSDGMSDFIYRNRIRVEYKGQVYHGCGEKY